MRNKHKLYWISGNIQKSLKISESYRIRQILIFFAIIINWFKINVPKGNIVIEAMPQIKVA